METASRVVASAQAGPHRDLEARVARHLAHPYRKPLLDYNRAAFSVAMAAREAWNPGAPIILDSGCGVGWSTLRLAGAHPGHFVIGVDQSLDRLQRGKPQALPANAVLVRADLVDFWRLLAAAGVRLARHYVLYPNPWPKIGHLARRWHGHAVFPVWRELGGAVEVRSNWLVYIDEMTRALELLGATAIEAAGFTTDDPMTPFEMKYLASGHALWRCTATLG